MSCCPHSRAPLKTIICQWRIWGQQGRREVKPLRSQMFAVVFSTEIVIATSCLFSGPQAASIVRLLFSTKRWHCGKRRFSRYQCPKPSSFSKLPYKIAASACSTSAIDCNRLSWKIDLSSSPRLTFFLVRAGNSFGNAKALKSPSSTGDVPVAVPNVGCRWILSKC